jgi:hypothetical protein
VADLKVFDGAGFIHGITIWADIDGGTVQLKDRSGNAIRPAAKTDYGGGYPFYRLHVHNGCFVTTTNFTAGLLSVFFSK